jgi:hypothetical protein
MLIQGSGNGAAAIVRGHSLGPQELKQWSTGFHWSPTGFFSGLNADVSWFRLEFQGLMTFNQLGLGPDDPISRLRYTVIPRPDLPITAVENAEFFELVQAVVNAPQRGSSFNPAAIPNIKFIEDRALINIGSRVFSGIDFTVRYDYDLGNFGSMHIGAAGYYELIDKSRANPAANIAHVYEGQESGNRLKRVRYRLGWENANWNATLFANYFGHGPLPRGFELVPPCYYAAGFGPGSCFPGSPYYGPSATYPNRTPATVYLDLTVGYQTGEMTPSPWLHNIGIQLTIVNLLDKAPPAGVDPRAAIDRNFPDLQRTFTLSLTKVW